MKLSIFDTVVSIVGWAIIATVLHKKHEKAPANRISREEVASTKASARHIAVSDNQEKKRFQSQQVPSTSISEDRIPTISMATGSTENDQIPRWTDSFIDLLYSKNGSVANMNNLDSLLQSISQFGSGDPQLQKILINQYIIDSQSSEGKHIFNAIKHFQGDYIQDLGKQLISSDDRSDVLAGLELSTYQKHPKRKLLNSVKDKLMDNMNDTDIILGALDVLNEVPMFSLGDPELKLTLTSLTSSRNELVREASSTLLGRLAEVEDDLSVLLDKLDIDDRISGLIGLTASSVQSQEAENKLIEIMVGHGEAPSIRQIAARGLDNIRLVRRHPAGSQ